MVKEMRRTTCCKYHDAKIKYLHESMCCKAAYEANRKLGSSLKTRRDAATVQGNGQATFGRMHSGMETSPAKGHRLEGYSYLDRLRILGLLWQI